MEFVTPDFLLNHSTNDIHEKMKAILPADIDVSQGGHAYNLTRPTALIAAEICEFILPEVIKLIFPEWSYGEFLNGHAKARSMTRRAATAASGEITITGTANTVIKAGSMFSTASINGEPSVDYKTLTDATIPESGTVTVAVECAQTGTIGNTPENTVILVASKLTGITAVTNAKPITGGTEEEDDDTLKARIDSYDKSQGDSFTGSPADYKRWALSVPGVGDATVIPATDDTGLVTIIVTDANGAPATETLLTSVYNYVMRPDAPGERLAPCNAYLKVVAPATLAIGVKATVEPTSGSTLEAIKADLLTALTLYLPEALEAGEVKYTRIAAVLSAVEGVNDYDPQSLEIGIKTDSGIAYGKSNIPIATYQLPAIDADDLVLTEGTV